MTNVQNASQYTGTDKLAMLAGWQRDDAWAFAAAACRHAGMDPRPQPAAAQRFTPRALRGVQ